MGYFQNTLLGQIVTPFDKKVKTYLKETFDYEISPALDLVFNSFVDQHKTLGFDVEQTSYLFLAVAINALEPDDKLETKRFVYEKNIGIIGALPWRQKKHDKLMPWQELRDLYIEVSSKHLPDWVIEELWSETEDSVFLMWCTDLLEEKDMEKLNAYFEIEVKE